MSRALVRRLLCSFALVALVIAAVPAHALPDGERVTFSPHVGYLFLSERSNADANLFLGGSVGFMFNRSWGIEGSIGYVPGSSFLEFGQIPALETGKNVDVRYLSAAIKYEFMHDSDLSPFVSLGWQQLRFTPEEATGGQDAYNGYEAGLGFLYEFSENEYYRAQVRLEGRYLLNEFKPPYISEDTYGNSFGAMAGIQVEFGDNWHRDTDGDGVIDRHDECADTAQRVIVDAQGCPIDSDDDGVFDGIDVSPGTPLGAEVDSLGTPLDDDQDGVFNGIDQCPTPIGAVVDERGCGIDTDGDTIFDGIDQCPGTPSGVPIDRETGCPRVDSDEEREFYRTGLYIASDIDFQRGNEEMAAGGTALLRPIANMMRKWPEMVIEVGGHTDDRGGLEQNQSISEQWAQVVADYLAENFEWITADRVTAVGYGEEKPIADNASEEGRELNRRIEFRITEGQPVLPE